MCSCPLRGRIDNLNYRGRCPFASNDNVFAKCFACVFLWYHHYFMLLVIFDLISSNSLPGEIRYSAVQYRLSHKKHHLTTTKIFHQNLRFQLRWFDIRSKTNNNINLSYTAYNSLNMRDWMSLIGHVVSSLIVRNLFWCARMHAASLEPPQYRDDEKTLSSFPFCWTCS